MDYKQKYLKYKKKYLLLKNLRGGNIYSNLNIYIREKQATTANYNAPVKLETADVDRICEVFDGDGDNIRHLRTQFKNYIKDKYGKEIRENEIIIAEAVPPLTNCAYLSTAPTKPLSDDTLIKNDTTYCIYYNPNVAVTLLPERIATGNVFIPDIREGSREETKRYPTYSETGKFINFQLVKGTRNYYGKHIDTGDFVNGELVYGKKTYGDNDSQEGEFKDGQLIDGTIIFPSGRKEQGKFIDGILADGSIIYPDGRKEEGVFVDGRLSNGSIIHPDGIREHGIFVDGRLSNGTITYPDGRKEEGEFRDFRLVKGKYTDTTGQVVIIDR